MASRKWPFGSRGFYRSIQLTGAPPRGDYQTNSEPCFFRALTAMSIWSVHKFGQSRCGVEIYMNRQPHNDRLNRFSWYTCGVDPTCENNLIMYRWTEKQPHKVPLLRADGQTDGWTDGRTPGISIFPAPLGRRGTIMKVIKYHH